MKRRTKTLAPLAPETCAALSNWSRAELSEDGGILSWLTRRADQGTIDKAYQGKNAHPLLVELVLSVRRHQSDEAEKSLAHPALTKLRDVCAAAVKADDVAFPGQLEFAMSYARDPQTPPRRAILRAWLRLTRGVTDSHRGTGERVRATNPDSDDVHRLAEKILGTEIPYNLFLLDLKRIGANDVIVRKRGEKKKST